VKKVDIKIEDNDIIKAGIVIDDEYRNQEREFMSKIEDKFNLNQNDKLFSRTEISMFMINALAEFDSNISKYNKVINVCI